MCLLASMMLDKEMIGAAVQLVERDAFYQADHQIIYDILVRLYEQNIPVDAIIVREELAKRQLLDEVGGTAYLAQILSAVPSSAHGAQYAGIVPEKHLLRQLIAASNEVLREAYAPHEKADVVLDRAEHKIFEIAQRKISGQIVSLGEVAAEVYEMIEEHERGRRGLETDFHEVDDMLNGLQASEMIIVAARPSMGKAQPLDAKVLTASGFKRMGDLRLGEQLASVDGAPSFVTGIYPQGRRQVYRITFADGRSTECCDEHLWLVHYRGWPQPRVVTTARLMQLLEKQRYRNRLWIELFNGAYGAEAELPLDAWLLGALLGDGTLCGSSVRFSTSSAQMLTRIEQAVGAEMSVTHAGNYDYRIIQRGGAHRKGVQGVSPNPITHALRQLGLWGCPAELKFIPACYIDAPRQTRSRLLAGLLDTDGWVEKFGSLRFATCSPQLARDVVALVRSLGGTARFHSKAARFRYRDAVHQGQPSYVCNLQLTNAAALELIDEKQSRLKPRRRARRLNVRSVEPTRVTQTQCIAVSHPSRLYVTDDFVVTHNTAFAMNIVEAVAANHRLPAAIFSLEMSKQQLAQRMLCSRAGVDAQKVRKGLLNAQEHQKLAAVVVELSKAPIWVDDSAGLTILELRAKARRLKLQHDIKLIMIDYMQLMDHPGAESRQQAISEISRGIKAVARELDIPVIALSQLNRQAEGRDGHRPRMSDLRESGSIEQDADVIMLLHREDYYRMAEPDFAPDNIAEVIIAKQRNGPTGSVKLTFDNRTTTFRNLAAQIDTF